MKLLDHFSSETKMSNIPQCICTDLKIKSVFFYQASNIFIGIPSSGPTINEVYFVKHRAGTGHFYKIKYTLQSKKKK